MRRPALAVLGLLGGLTLGACSTAGGGTPQPSAVSTPPAVERTVAAGTTVSSGPGDAAPAVATATSSAPMSGMSMSGMSMPGMSMPDTPSPAASDSVVPNGRGPHEVPAVNADGCYPEYGSAAECVPVRAPGGGPLTCEVLQQYHFLPLLVTKDPLGLLSRKGAAVHVRQGKRYLTGCSA